MLGTCETVRVVREGSRLGYRIINKADFDPSRHVLWVESGAVSYPREDRPVVDPRPASPSSIAATPVRRLGRRLG